VKLGWRASTDQASSLSLLLRCCGSACALLQLARASTLDSQMLSRAEQGGTLSDLSYDHMPGEPDLIEAKALPSTKYFIARFCSSYYHA
jgi:hypothetical protein